MFFAGIDWGDEGHDAHVVDEAGRSIGSTHVAHSPEGMAKLRQFLSSIAGDPESIPCFVETNNGLLITSLLEMGFPVFPMNPKTLDRRRKPSGAKTDRIDAYLLARTGRSELADLRRLKPDSPIVLELKILTRDQDSLVQNQTRLVNQLTACLKAYYPAALELFCKLQQPTALAFLQAYPTPSAAMRASVDEIAVLLKEHHHPSANLTAQKIFQKLHEPHLTADPATTRAKARLMLALVSQISPLLDQIKAYDGVGGQIICHRFGHDNVYGQCLSDDSRRLAKPWQVRAGRGSLALGGQGPCRLHWQTTAAEARLPGAPADNATGGWQ